MFVNSIPFGFGAHAKSSKEKQKSKILFMEKDFSKYTKRDCEICLRCNLDQVNGIKQTQSSKKKLNNFQQKITLFTSL